MKKNKKITFIALLISLCALASAFALAACNGGKQPEEPHVHQYSEEWTSDETYHWHKAICEHTDLRTAPEMHIDDDFDDICDVCLQPITHEHRFDQTKWEANENGHYHPSLCGHPDSVTLVPHAFDGVEFVETCEKDYNLQICTECQYQKIEIITDYGENPNHEAHMSSEIAEKKATCMEEGDIAHYECNTCGKYFLKEADGSFTEITEEQLHEGLPVDKENGHAYDLTHGKVTVPATCTTEGTEEFPCLNGCGTPKVQTVPKTPHSWNADGECTVCETERKYEIIAVMDDGITIDEEATKTVQAGDEHARLIMGEYPQTLMHDDGTGLINNLNRTAGVSSPDEAATTIPQSWTQFNAGEELYTTYIQSTKPTADTTPHMWYKDVEFEGLKYRGIYFDAYRRDNEDYPAINVHRVGPQQYRGYIIDKIYWFRYEPIRWRFLKQRTSFAGSSDGIHLTVKAGAPTEEDNSKIPIKDTASYHYIDTTTNYVYTGQNYNDISTGNSNINCYEIAGKLPPEGCYTVVADLVLDGTRFDNKINLDSKYDTSNLHKFLTEDFYDLAFTDAEKNIIQTAEVVNTTFSTESMTGRDPITGKPVNSHCCDNTEDKIFTLSYAEITEIYEFPMSQNNWSCPLKGRYTQIFNSILFDASDYAACVGVQTQGFGFSGTKRSIQVRGSDWYASEWWCRSPFTSDRNEFYGSRVYEEGMDSVGGGYPFKASTFLGVLPAMWVRL